MKILHLSCLNNDPEIQPYLGPKCAPVGGEPLIHHNLSNEVQDYFTCFWATADLSAQTKKNRSIILALAFL